MLKNWLVAYTKPRHEKKSAEVLKSSGVDVFLPLQKQLKVWSDRKKWVESPLFPGYLFVNISDDDYFKVLNSYGIVKYIFFNQKPAVVKDDVIDSIQKLMSDEINSCVEIKDIELIIGEEFCINKGPLKGLKGKLLNFKGKNKIAIEIECMKKAVLVEVDKSFLT